ncbi:hypothetical protein KY311_01830 [Candidatus Woesearchaeota archaeon]|nr:hypothetical protein [Candidatus Woesearchaeota archaeon]
MALVGFNFLKISGERTGELKGKINVNNNVILRKIQKSALGLNLGTDQGIEVGFEFSSKYSPEVGQIVMTGNILLLEKKDVAETILSTWEKEKKLPPRLMQQVFSTILRKCNIKALNMAEDLGLPSPIKLPDVKLGKRQAPAPAKNPAAASQQKPAAQPQKKPEEKGFLKKK